MKILRTALILACTITTPFAKSGVDMGYSFAQGVGSYSIENVPTRSDETLSYWFMRNQISFGFTMEQDATVFQNIILSSKDAYHFGTNSYAFSSVGAGYGLHYHEKERISLYGDATILGAYQSAYKKLVGDVQVDLGVNIDLGMMQAFIGLGVGFDASTCPDDDNTTKDPSYGSLEAYVKYGLSAEF